jgi:MbtH protein
MMSTNPFDDHNGASFVLIDDEEQHSLWPACTEVPAGRHVAYGKASRPACLEYVEQNWTDMRPKSPRDAMAGPDRPVSTPGPAAPKFWAATQLGHRLNSALTRSLVVT